MSAYRTVFATLASLLLAAAAARAQETPVVANPIPDVNFTGLGSATIDLRDHFAAPDLAGATIVQVKTNLGTMNFRMLGTDAPLTVQNFLNYVNRGAYTNTLIHRSIPGFVFQGGGYTATLPTRGVTEDPPVVNEAKVSNLRGTVAMARTEALDSATSQWFVNLVNNTDLDKPANVEKGGYAVFARVVGTGMTVADAIAAVPTYNGGTGFENLPLRNYNGGALSATYFVTVNSAAVVPVFPTETSAASVVAFTGEFSAPNILSGTFTGSLLTLSSVGTADGPVDLTITATDSNGNKVSDTFKLTASHIVAAGNGTQVGFNITHPNGNIFDQVLLAGTTATVSADPAQVTRLSFVDLNDDIVQLEFTGAGTLKVTLENATGPAAPAKYNQAVNYMKGHAIIEITGANETTHVGITSVGKLTAFDPTGAWDLTKPVSATNDPLANGNPIFKAGEVYDGIADVALLSIASTNGKFGSVRCAGAGFFRISGRTGIDAPGVEFTGRVLLHDLTASGSATPVLLTGAVGTAEAAGSDFNGKINIAGGDLTQANGQAIQLGDAQKVKSRDNRNSHFVYLPAQTLQAQFTRNGANVTAQVVENP